jgi:DNA-directed RNA polymerase specialized sigma24 family protein
MCDHSTPLSEFAYSVNLRSNAVLVNDYIKEHANRIVPGTVPCTDREEIVQNANLKFWINPRKEGIQNLKAYLYTVVSSSYMDYLRKNKHLLGSNLASLDDSYSNEAQAALAIEAPSADELLCTIEALEPYVIAIINLSDKQRLAMICHVKEGWPGDMTALVEAFKLHDVDITSIEWPEDKEQKRLLRASLYQARKNLEQRLRGIRPLGDAR